MKTQNALNCKEGHSKEDKQMYLQACLLFTVLAGALFKRVSAQQRSSIEEYFET